MTGHPDAPTGREANNRMAETNYPKVAIVVLNWNGWRDTIECLESLQRITYPNYQVILVDNGSTDDSVARIRASYPSTPLVETGKNLGYGGGNNAGISYALEQGAEYILIVNNDVKVETDALTAMVDAAEESNASVVGALVKDSLGRTVLFSKSHYPAMMFFSEPQGHIPNKGWWLTDQVQGSAMLLRRDLLLEREQSLGYFLDESLFLYCEEIELGLWCRRNGMTQVVTRHAVVYHKVGASSTGKSQPLRFYYLTRNRMLLASRYLKWPFRLVYFVLYPIARVIRTLMYCARGRTKVSVEILRGLLDGCRGKGGPRR